MNPYAEKMTAPLLQMKGIHKSFPGVQALSGVDLQMDSGEVMALIGENGAGKSTLIKVLSGAHLPDAGSIRIEGELQQITDPVDAQRSGVAVIYQEFNLIPSLSARENIFLGQERTQAGFIRQREEREAATKLFQRLGVAVDPDLPCGELTIAQQQIVEIAKALSLEARIIVMDEPTATLTGEEVSRLFAIICELKAQGIGIVYVSHRLQEISEIADRVTVLRDGFDVATCRVTEVRRERLIELMVGRKLESEFPPREAKIGDTYLEVRGLSHGKQVKEVSFSLRRGEIVGMTGLVGSGRTDTAHLIFGARQPESGSIVLQGKSLRLRSPGEAIANGICLLSEDRKAEGLILDHSPLENFGLPNLSRFSRLGFVNSKQERTVFKRYVKSLRISMPDLDRPSGNLSGGNQQKVVLAKWLEAHSEVILFDEPTRGIDVGAKYEIYVLINELAEQGKAILMISSELPEILGMCDRVLVMHEGRITGEITDVEQATQEQIMNLAMVTA